MPANPTRQRNAVATYAIRAAIVLTLKDAEGRPMTVPQLVEALRAQGVVVPGRPGKTISDATRTDVRMGRIVRTRAGPTPIADSPERTPPERTSPERTSPERTPLKNRSGVFATNG